VLDYPSHAPIIPRIAPLPKQGDDLVDLPDVIVHASADGGCRGHGSQGRTPLSPHLCSRPRIRRDASSLSGYLSM
jgi:hypothetical protein